MREVLEYLKECGVFYVATDEQGQPRVRPFGAVADFEGKLYISTNNQKDVFKQMQKNPKIEISGMKNDTWIRVKAAVVRDNRKEAREKCLPITLALKKCMPLMMEKWRCCIFKTQQLPYLLLPLSLK